MLTVENAAPARPRPPAHPTGWQIDERPGSGTFVLSSHGTMLFRIDRAAGLIYLWDKKSRSEVPVKLAELGLLQSATA